MGFISRKLIVFFGVLLAVGTAFGQPTFPSVKLKMGHFIPSTFSQADVDQWFVDEVRRRSNGAVDIEIFWAGSMGGPSELLGLVSSGALDLAAFPIAYYPRQFPLTGVGTLPRVFVDNEQAYKTTKVLWDLPEVQAEHRKNNVTPLTSHFTTEYRIACNKPVARASQVRGYRVRSFGEFFPLMLREAGLVPVNTAAGEVYEALDKGNLDCSVLSYDQIYASKTYEVAKHASTINIGSLMSWQIWMNNPRLAGLPENVRTLLVSVGKEAMERDVSSAKAAVAKAPALLREKGVTFQDMEDEAAFLAKMPSALELWEKRQRAAGLEKEVKPIMNIMGPAAAGFK